jgi:hypothetical protein
MKLVRTGWTKEAQRATLTTLPIGRALLVSVAALFLGPFSVSGTCVQTSITPTGQPSHAAIALTDPVGEQTAVFDLVWGGMLASLRYNGTEHLMGGHTIAMVQPNLYSYFGPNQYAPFGAGDYALRGSNVPGVYCTTPDKVFILTGMTDFAAGASGNTPLNAVQDGSVVPAKYAVPYTLTTVARFVPNPLGQPQYFLKLENQLLNNHPSESLAFGFLLRGSMQYDHGYTAVGPSNCQDANCSSASTPYLVAGGYTDAGLTNGVAFFVSPQVAWNTPGGQAFATFGVSSNPQFRSANLVSPVWGVAPLTARVWSWYVLAGPWTKAVAFAQAGGPEYEGNLDGADCHVITGWAWDRNQPTTPINVDIYDGASLLATIPANQYRPDLVAAGIGNGYHGFWFNTPASIRGGQTHSIRAVPSGTILDVSNSPRSLSCPGESFYTLTPCRVVDTRSPTGPYGGPSLQAGATRTFTLVGQCGIPSSARAVAINLTVTGSTSGGSLTVFPANLPQVPGTSSINYSAGQTRACSAVLGLDPTGSVAITVNQASGTVNFILDVGGYFQ